VWSAAVAAATAVSREVHLTVTTIYEIKTNIAMTIFYCSYSGIAGRVPE